jgi:GAF domain-containing protein
MTMSTTTPTRRANPLLDSARLLAVAAATPRGATEGPVSACLNVLVQGAATGLPAGSSVAVNLVWHDVIFILAGHGLPPLLSEIGGMPLEWALCGLVIRDQAPLLINDTHARPEYDRVPDGAMCAIRSYAGVPLRDPDGQWVGTVVATHPEPNAFGRVEMGVLTVVAGYAEGALFPGA